MKKILITLLLISSVIFGQLTYKIGKAKTNFVTTPPSSLNESGLVFAYTGNQPINKTIVDASGNGNNGTLNGGVVYAGGLEGGLQFNGTSGYVSVADANSLDFGTSSFAVELYIKYKTKASTQQFILKYESGSSYRFSVGANSSNYLFAAIADNASGYVYTLTNDILLTDGQTYHILVIYDRTNKFIYRYINGIKSGTDKDITSVNGSVSSSGALLLGASYSSEYSPSIIYSAKLYNRALTAEEVKDKWNKIANKPYIIEDFSDTQVGKFPRDWTRVSGTHTIQQTTTDEGIVKKGTKYLRTDVAGIVAFPSNQAYGRWSFDLYKGGESNLLSVNFISDIRDRTYNDAKYAFIVWSNETLRISKDDNGLFITVNSYISNNTWYHIDIERTNAGVFSVYITGGAFTTKTLVSTSGGSGTNPVTDNTYTTSKYFVLDLDAGDRITNIKMYKGIPVQ